MQSRVEIIAEAGVNHNGSLELALQLIDAAAHAGADTVKFQTFRSEKVISKSAPKAAYQQRTTGSDESQLDMVRALELGADAHRALIARCAERKVRFLSTPFDEESVDLLIGLGLDRLKIPSGEITNLILLRKIARARVPLILSTGMSTLDEIRAALDVIGRDRVTLLHCTTEYPAPLADVNLRAMVTLRDTFGLPVGYSDHTQGIAVPLAAVALGATVIEKHFTLDRNMPGPDHQASLEPAQLAEMVRGIRAVEEALGSPEKRVTPSEQKNLAIARRSLVAARAIRRGEPFTLDNVTAKRPGGGVSPMRLDEILGKPADRDYAEDEPIRG